MTRLHVFTALAGAAVCCAVLAPQLHGQAATRVDVEFTDWNTVTPGAHPHDPAFGVDGRSLWYTGSGRTSWDAWT